MLFDFSSVFYGPVPVIVTVHERSDHSLPASFTIRRGISRALSIFFRLKWWVIRQRYLHKLIDVQIRSPIVGNAWLIRDDFVVPLPPYGAKEWIGYRIFTRLRVYSRLWSSIEGVGFLTCFLWHLFSFSDGSTNECSAWTSIKSACFAPCFRLNNDFLGFCIPCLA